VIENVKIGAHFGARGILNETEAAREAMSFVGLEGKENMVASSLKLLDKKLTMLAAALATRPKLLLLDEPIAGLNPGEVRQFMEMVTKIKRELKLTLIIIEHFMKVLSELSDRLMILENGQSICIGSPQEVVKDKRVIKTYLGESHA